MIRRWLSNLAHRGQLWAQESAEVASFEGIRISDLGSGKQSPAFRETIIAALDLVKRLDPRRFQRVRRHIDWIVNTVSTDGGARYVSRSRTCEFDLEDPVCLGAASHEFRTGWCASSLVHEATHGLIASKGIPYTAALRGRIEAVCVAEEHRFLNRLAAVNPELARELRCEFDESRWHASWQTSPFQEAILKLRRLWKR
jgi:hypothetical protein